MRGLALGVEEARSFGKEGGRNWRRNERKGETRELSSTRRRERAEATERKETHEIEGTQISVQQIVPSTETPHFQPILLHHRHVSLLFIPLLLVVSPSDLLPLQPPIWSPSLPDRVVRLFRNVSSDRPRRRLRWSNHSLNWRGRLRGGSLCVQLLRRDRRAFGDGEVDARGRLG